MSTKRLQRTVIEGGRHGSNKYDRRSSHTEERNATRDYCKRVMADPESAEDFEIEPKGKVFKEFRDKLNPMYRWLEKQVGRPWSEVRSEVFKTFDTRTTAGRHITFDHLLSSIVETNTGFDKFGRMANPALKEDGSPSRSHYEYYVDENDILCQSEKRIRQKYQWVTEQQYRDSSNWLSGRMISEKGGQLSWHCPMEGIWLAAWINPNERYDMKKLRYYLLDNGPYKIRYSYEFHDMILPQSGMSHGDHWEEVENPFSFRQRGELNKEELQYFKELPERLQRDILLASKGR